MTDTRSVFSTVLGVVLMTQATTAALSRSLFPAQAANASSVAETLTILAAHAGIARTALLLDVVTALAVVGLAALLHNLLRGTNGPLATTALVTYALEAGLLLVSKSFGFALVTTSLSYAAAPDPALALLGQTLRDAQNTAYTLHLVAFGVGAVGFYYLLTRAKPIPSWLAWWGLLAVIPIPVCAVVLLLGQQPPPAVMLPYLPWEWFTGLYVLIKGLRPSPRVITRECTIDLT